MMDRYKVVKGSESVHCCFEFTILDSQGTDKDFGNICECFDEETANRICRLLNQEQ